MVTAEAPETRGDMSPSPLCHFTCAVTELGWDRAGSPADYYAHVRRDHHPSSRPNSSCVNHGPPLPSHGWACPVALSFQVSWAGTYASLSGPMAGSCLPTRLLSSFSSWRFSKEQLHCRKHAIASLATLACSVPSPDCVSSSHQRHRFVPGSRVRGRRTQEHLGRESHRPWPAGSELLTAFEM